MIMIEEKSAERRWVYKLMQENDKLLRAAFERVEAEINALRQHPGSGKN
jgi:hypothetical protein